MKHSKHQRLLAGLLSIVMMFSLFAPAVSAASVQTAETPAVEAQIPANECTATAGNQNDNGESAASNVLKDDHSLWHTNWNGTARENQWIALKITPTDKYVVTGLYYLPRPEGNKNGLITKYRIEGRNGDNDPWTVIASGDWANDHAGKNVTFASQYFSQYRLVSVESVAQGDIQMSSAQQVRLLGHEMRADEEHVAHTYEKIANGTESQMYKTAHATSRMPEALPNTDGPEKWAFDANVGTAWHTRYDNNEANGTTQLPYDIEWSMGEATVVGQLGYLRKPNAGNGPWKDVTVYGKNGADAEWTVIDRFSAMEQTNREVLLTFREPVTVTNIKVTITASYNTSGSFASAGEINVYKAAPAEKPVGPVGEYQRIPQKDIVGSVTFSSQETTGEQSPAANAFDNNPGTFWHSQYNPNKVNPPHWVQWSVGEAKNLGRVDYVKRPGGGNGELYNVTVLGKNGTGDNWITLADHVAINAGDSRTSIYFKPQQLTDLKVAVNSSKNDFAAAAEFYTYEQVDSGKVDKQALRDAYADAGEIVKENCTDTSAKKLTDAMNEVLAVLNNKEATEANVQEVTAKLAGAIKNLAPAEHMIAPGAPNDGHGNKTTGQPFANGTGTSDHFRIPSIITLKHQKGDFEHLNGRLVAAIDARWNHMGDACSLDTILSVSNDKGENWTYSFPNFFNDTTNTKANNGTAFIDPVMVEAEDGTIYMMVDLFPGGVAINTAPRQPAVDSGYRMIHEKQRMILYTGVGNAQNNDNYTYYVGEFAADPDKDNKMFAPVLAKDAELNGTAVYYVDNHYYLYDADKAPLYCRQIEGGNLNGAKFVQQNVFFYNADLHVRDATYLWVIASKNGGQTWGAPMIMNPMVRKSPAVDKFYGVGPGAGLSFVAEDNTNIIMLPAYTHQNERSSFIYSYDNGATWHRAPDATTNQSSESALIQIDATKVRQFYRSGARELQYTDFTWNPETHKFTTNATPMSVPHTVKTAGNQLSAIKYSVPAKDGRDVYLVSTSSADNRANGRIHVLALNDNKTMEVINVINVNDNGAAYSYSSLTETKDHDIALLFEADNRIEFRIIGKDKVLPVTEQVQLTVDEIVTFPLEGDIKSNSNEYAVEPFVTIESQEPAQGLTGNNKQFNTGRKALTDALLTFDAQAGNNTYRISGMAGTEKVYMQINTASGTGGCPIMGNSDGSMTLENSDVAGSFYIKNATTEANGRYLYFNDSNCVYDAFNANSGAVPNNLKIGARFMLYRPAPEGEKVPTDLPGFVKITSLDQIQDGGQYLLVRASGSDMFVMNPSKADSNQKFDYVLKVDSSNFTKTLNLKGVRPGTAQVAANGKVYSVTVADNDNNPDTLPNRVVNFYAYINGQLTLMERRRDVTTYWQNGGKGNRQGIDALTLESVYGKLGFKAEQLTNGTNYFLHTDPGQGSIWKGGTSVDVEGNVYAASINHNYENSVNIELYYLPNQGAGYGESVGKQDAGMMAKETFYTVTIGDEVRYFKTGENVVVTVPGSGWTMSDNIEGVVAADKSSTTFTVNGINKAYTITQNDSLFKVIASGMTLGSSLQMEFYVKKSDLPADTTGLYAVVTKSYADDRGNVTEQIPFPQWKDRVGDNSLMYVPFDGVAAKEMMDTFTVQIFNADNEPVSAVYTDSIHDYAVRMIRKENDAELKTLLVDMLNYGAEAQKQFKYDEANLANADLTVEEQDLATKNVTLTAVPAESVKEYAGTAPALNNNIRMSMYFNGTSTDGLRAVVTYTDHYNNLHTENVDADQFDLSWTGKYGVHVDTLAVADFNQMVKIEVFKGEELVASATDSIAHYAGRMAAKNESQAIYEAMVKFGTSSHAYFHPENK